MRRSRQQAAAQRPPQRIFTHAKRVLWLTTCINCRTTSYSGVGASSAVVLTAFVERQPCDRAAARRRRPRGPCTAAKDAPACHSRASGVVTGSFFLSRRQATAHGRPRSCAAQLRRGAERPLQMARRTRLYITWLSCLTCIGRRVSGLARARGGDGPHAARTACARHTHHRTSLQRDQTIA